MSRIMVATGSKVLDLDGERVVIVKGRTTAEESAEIVKACPDLFGPLVPQYGSGDYEQATAAPGEKRNAPPGLAKATAKKATGMKKKAAAKKRKEERDEAKADKPEDDQPVDEVEPDDDGSGADEPDDGDDE